MARLFKLAIILLVQAHEHFLFYIVSLTLHSPYHCLLKSPRI